MQANNINKTQKLPHYFGHRARLKEKFLANEPAVALNDYEILELLLFQAVPRKDVKPMAKELLQVFGSLTQLINADKTKVLAIPNVTESVYLQMKLIRELLNRIFYEDISNKNILSSWSAVVEYLKFSMGCSKVESFRILFLNKKNILLADEVISTGTIDQTPVYPREIVKKALFYEAGAIILVHNHPSGNPKPSNADIDLTTHIVNACKTVNISVHDHVIIGHGKYYSFKSNMLL